MTMTRARIRASVTRFVIPAGVIATVCVSALGVRCHGAGARDAPADSTKPESDAAAETSTNVSAQGPALWVWMEDPR